MDLLDLDETAARLRVSRRTVEREIARGRLALTKVGGSSFVRESEIVRYLKANERRAA